MAIMSPAEWLMLSANRVYLGNPGPSRCRSAVHYADRRNVARMCWCLREENIYQPSLGRGSACTVATGCVVRASPRRICIMLFICWRENWDILRYWPNYWHHWWFLSSILLGCQGKRVRVSRGWSLCHQGRMCVMYYMHIQATVV